MAIATVDPATGKTVRTFQPHTEAQVEEKLARALAGARLQRELPVTERAKRMGRAAQVLQARREELGRLMTLEMGKLKNAALAEVDKCALGCRYYAENGPAFVADEAVKTDAVRSFIRYQPLGVVLAVMPWNFPLWQVFRFSAPGLVAGNAAVLKHASNVPQCALAIEDIFREAGFPQGAFQTLLIEGSRASKLLDDPRIAAATLTGSEGAGRSIGEAAGRNIKKVVLELGGSDPFIVMPSADLEKAVKVGVEARVQNAGQSCIAAKRFIVHERIHDEFAQRMAKRISELRVGDPNDESTAVGPLSSKQVLDDLEDQVKRMIAKGSKVLAGGKRLDRPGHAGSGRGDLRTGRHALQGARRRRGAPARQRDEVRPRLGGLDARRRRGAALHRRAAGRPGVHQRHGEVRPAPALRGHQVERPRTRAVRHRHARVRQLEDGLDRRGR